MKFKNKNVGARVIVDKITIAINPKDKWKYLRKLTGVIVENKNYEQYYHSCSGGYTYTKKHIIKDDCFKTFAVKLDNNIVDIEGNNIIIVREFDLKFIDFLDNVKIISKKEYNNALKLVDEYEKQQLLK